jgi:hypothetical protein
MSVFLVVMLAVICCLTGTATAGYSPIVCGDGTIHNETNLLRVGDGSTSTQLPLDQCLPVASRLSAKLRNQFPNASEATTTVECYTRCVGGFGDGDDGESVCKAFLRSPNCDSMDNLKALLVVRAQRYWPCTCIGPSLLHASCDGLGNDL